MTWLHDKLGKSGSAGLLYRYKRLASMVLSAFLSVDINYFLLIGVLKDGWGAIFFGGQLSSEGQS
jgi:hypothetical protein